MHRQPFTGLITSPDGTQHRHSCIGTRLYSQFAVDNMSPDQIDYSSMVCSEDCEVAPYSGLHVRFASPPAASVSDGLLDRF